MPSVVIENPILNSPFAEPTQHFRFDDANNITPDIETGRRMSSHVLPIAAGRSLLCQPGN